MKFVNSPRDVLHSQRRIHQLLNEEIDVGAFEQVTQAQLPPIRQYCKKFEQRVFKVGKEDNFRLTKLNKQDILGLPQKRESQLDTRYILSKQKFEVQANQRANESPLRLGSSSVEITGKKINLDQLRGAPDSYREYGLLFDDQQHSTVAKNREESEIKTFRPRDQSISLLKNEHNRVRRLTQNTSPDFLPQATGPIPTESNIYMNCFNNTQTSMQLPTSGSRAMGSGFKKLPGSSMSHQPSFKMSQSSMNAPSRWGAKSSYIHQQLVNPGTRSSNAGERVSNLGLGEPTSTYIQRHQRTSDKKELSTGQLLNARYDSIQFNEGSASKMSKDGSYLNQTQPLHQKNLLNKSGNSQVTIPSVPLKVRTVKQPLVLKPQNYSKADFIQVKLTRDRTREIEPDVPYRQQIRIMISPKANSHRSTKRKEKSPSMSNFENSYLSIQQFKVANESKQSEPPIEGTQSSAEAEKLMSRSLPRNTQALPPAAGTAPVAKDIIRFTQRIANKMQAGSMGQTQILGRPSTQDRTRGGGFKKHPVGHSMRYKNPALLEKLDTKSNIQKMNILKKLGSISGINLMLEGSSNQKHIFQDHKTLRSQVKSMSSLQFNRGSMPRIHVNNSPEKRKIPEYEILEYQPLIVSKFQITGLNQRPDFNIKCRQTSISSIRNELSQQRTRVPKKRKNVLSKQHSPSPVMRFKEVEGGTVHKRNSMKLDGAAEASTCIMSLKENEVPVFARHPREDFAQQDDSGYIEENPLYAGQMDEGVQTSQGQLPLHQKSSIEVNLQGAGSPHVVTRDEETGKIIQRNDGTELHGVEEHKVLHKDETKHLYSSISAGVQSSSHLSQKGSQESFAVKHQRIKSGEDLQE